MLHKYRKIDPIKAEQLDGSDKMIKKYKLVKSVIYKGAYVLPRLYGPMPIVWEGDWIIINAEGGYRRMTDEEFHRTYERCD